MPQMPDGVDPRDWVTIWQSEWAAIAVDRELAEALAATTDAWNQALAAGPDGPSGQPRTDAAAGSAAAGAASGAEPVQTGA